MADNLLKGIVGLLTLLAVFGGGMYLSQDQLDNAYYCTLTESWGIFYGGTSSSGLTAYPYSENRSDYARCTKDGLNGAWIKLSDYATEQGISINDLTQPKPEPEPGQSHGIWGTQYSCNQTACVEIGG